MIRYLSIDTETALMRGGCLVPPLVCASFAERWSGDNFAIGPEDVVCHGEIVGYVVKWDSPNLEPALLASLLDSDVHFVGATIRYDMAVLGNAFPDLWSLIWSAYAAGRVHDVCLMAKLYDISTTGDIEFRALPDGSRAKQHYSLDALGQRFLGIDRSAEKKGADAWRLRYGELRDVPLEQWPAEAVAYARMDAEETLLVFEHLQGLRQEVGHGSMNTEAFQAAADFALWLISAWGVETDAERVQRLVARLAEELAPDKMAPLYAAGLLTPAKPAEPYKRDPNKFKAPVPEKANSEAVKDFVVSLCKRYGLEVKRTAPSTKFPAGQVSTDREVMARLIDAAEDDARADEVIRTFVHRSKMSKVQSMYAEVLQSPIVHFSYDPLVSSGRTSSYGQDIFPSMNGQNFPRLAGDLSVRECVVPRAGHLFLTVDYSVLELCVLAQQLYKLFGRSSLRTRIEKGYDLHAFLATQIAIKKEPAFADLVREHRADADGAYRLFKGFAKSDDAELVALHDHYRGLAKPTGLGYPGGLGPETFRSFAKATYGVSVSFEEARELREIWFDTVPEMRRYFDWIPTLEDRHNVKRLAYTSPMGMHRAGASFCEVANGFGLQTPAAEGAKAAVFETVRACLDPSLGHILYGCHPVNFVHDELITEIPDDDLATARATAKTEIMVGAMSRILPDVKISAEPCLMRRWYKGAKPVYIDGRLVPWEPKPKPMP